MIMRTIAVVAPLLLCAGCAKSGTAPAAASQPSAEGRKPVSAETKQGHTIKDEGNGKYYIMMDQHERLCSDCDR